MTSYCIKDSWHGCPNHGVKSMNKLNGDPFLPLVHWEENRLKTSQDLQSETIRNWVHSVLQALEFGHVTMDAWSSLSLIP